MQRLRGAVGGRLLIIVAVTLVAAWLLSGDTLMAGVPSTGVRPALAAADANPTALTADRHDTSPPLKSLAAQPSRSTPRSEPSRADRAEQPLGRRPYDRNAPQQRDVRPRAP